MLTQPSCCTVFFYRVRVLLRRAHAARRERTSGGEGDRNIYSLTTGERAAGARELSQNSEVGSVRAPEVWRWEREMS